MCRVWNEKVGCGAGTREENRIIKKNNRDILEGLNMCSMVLGNFAVRYFVVGYFAVGYFAVRKFRRKEVSP